MIVCRAGSRPITAPIRRRVCVSTSRRGVTTWRGSSVPAAASGRNGRVEQEVDVVDERDPRALPRQDPLQRARGVEAAEPASRYDDVPGDARESSDRRRLRPAPEPFERWRRRPATSSRRCRRRSRAGKLVAAEQLPADLAHQGVGGCRCARRASDALARHLRSAPDRSMRSDVGGRGAAAATARGP